MKDKKDNEDEPLWFSIMMWAIVIIAIIGIIFLINYSLPKEVPNSVKCGDECNKFNMTYYKTNLIYNTLICWCLDSDGKPRSIGGLK